MRFREKSLKKSSVWRWRRFEHIAGCRPVATDDGGIEETVRTEVIQEARFVCMPGLACKFLSSHYVQWVSIGHCAEDHTTDSLP